MGKHSAPTTPILTPARVGATVALTGVALAGTSIVNVAEAHAATNDVWNAIIHCESGGKNVKNPSSSAQGYFQIINGTWAANGGKQFAPSAMGASFDQQFTVAKRIEASQGLGAWVCPWRSMVGRAPNYIGMLSGQSAPVASVTVSQPQQMAASTYRVVRGDTLFSIGRRFGVSWLDLYQANRDKIGNPNRIYPGQVLNITGNQSSGTHVDSGSAHAAGFESPLARGSYRIGQPFKGDAHRGVDLPAADGTPEYAVTNSVVEFAGHANGFGQWIVLQANVDGMQVDFVYGHEWPRGVLVHEGQSIPVGQQVGNVGANGDARGAHLHFEVWIGGRLHGHPVDPVGWLAAHGVNL